MPLSSHEACMTATIVYDWNGTLLDDSHLALESFNRTFECFGHKRVSLEKFREIYVYPNTFFGEIGFGEEEIENHFPEMMQKIVDFYSEVAHKAQLRDGAKQLLVKMKGAGVRQIILSNSVMSDIIEQLARLGIGEIFDAVLAHKSADDHAARKEKKDLLVDYMKENNLNPTRMISVGDAVGELIFSKNLGVGCVAITGGIMSESRLRAVGPDHVIHSLAELEPILVARGLVGVGGGR